MKKHLSYKTYLNKVYGCFLGKGIGGTAGGPAEGRKEWLDYPLNEELLHTALPNDDLELQVMWLELIEEIGFDISARDMAKAFYEKVPYGPGEYAAFLKNYERGIYPPLSGSFNNRYYKNGMGCPIRSEIWACLFPGDTDSVNRYVRMDGSLDHEKDSIDAEVFLADVEARLFFTDDLMQALSEALANVPNGKLKNVLSDTLRLYRDGASRKFARSMILKNYGHADCTNMYQNLGFILLALLWGGGDFRETVRIGLACGYDTDCICATAASILGIMLGADRLLGENGLTDTGLVIDIRTRRKSGSIYDLARDVYAAGIVAGTLFSQTEITELPSDTSLLYSEQAKPVPVEPRQKSFTVSALYDGDPVIGVGKPCAFELQIDSHLSIDSNVTLTLTAPDGIDISPNRLQFRADAKSSRRFRFLARLKDGLTVLSQKNIVTVTLTGDSGVYEDTFGIVGCEVWYRYGPFLENIRDLTHLPPKEPYQAHLLPHEGENTYDLVREYHLGGIADIDHAFANESEPFLRIEPNDAKEMTENAEYLPVRTNISEDLFDTAAIQPYEGAHVGYLLRNVFSPERRKVELAVGHTAPFKLWVNGKLIGEDRSAKWWTAENRHFTVLFSEGINTVILKYAQMTDHAAYSVVYRIDGGRWRQFGDMGSGLL